MRAFWRKIVLPLGLLLGLWLAVELGMRVYLEAPLRTDFYGSIARDAVRERQAQAGVHAVSGPGWIHLGWVADPEREAYRIQRRQQDAWVSVGSAQYGSFLLREVGGTYRILAKPNDGAPDRLLGELTAQAASGGSPVFVPRIAGTWQLLFQPTQSGAYVNDHAIYQDAVGNWQLVGITSKTNGDFSQEKYFVTAASASFPPSGGMAETGQTADFGELAWAPHVIRVDGTYHLFWTPHRLHHMDSRDGITWENHTVTLSAPFHKYFRDGMVLQVADGQWLLYATARGAYFSQVDVYQSFDLKGWQYIGTAMRSRWGSERNSPFGSMESPFVVAYQDHYYLSLTYNNDSFFWPGILLTFQVWLNPASYNETLIFHADNPYDFGSYGGRQNAPTLLTVLETHAPEYVHNPQTDAWYITTAGWPWVATLTHGEVAVAPIEWGTKP
jgi:hypothetical protein